MLPYASFVHLTHSPSSTKLHSNKYSWRPGRHCLSPANLLTFPHSLVLWSLKYFSSGNISLFVPEAGTAPLQKLEQLHSQSSGKPNPLWVVSSGRTFGFPHWNLISRALGPACMLPMRAQPDPHQITDHRPDTATLLQRGKAGEKSEQSLCLSGTSLVRDNSPKAL